MLLEGYAAHHVFYQAAGSIGGPRDPSMLFEPKAIAVDFADLIIEHLDQTKVILDEGKRHKGPSAVIRLRARKR